MHWWIATVVCICAALIIQYFCSSKLLRMKQQISIKNMALRDAREEGSRLEEQETELKNQQKSLTYSIQRMRTDIKRLQNQLIEKGLDVPEPKFSPEELEAETQDEEA
jgi:septal ring factor EnvC (AmiA/AmiB activator)